MTGGGDPVSRPSWETVPCSRLTRAGKACSSSAAGWEWALRATGLPDPVSCRRHRTRPEHDAWRAGEDTRQRARVEAQAKVMPACWSWPVTVEDSERAFRASRDGEDYWPAMAVVRDWQAGRCAICSGGGGEYALAGDHDHDTGYFRGLLCVGCNSSEGHAGEGVHVYARYRFRPPAVILGVRIYWAAPDSRRAVRAMFAAAGVDQAEALARHMRDTDPELRGCDLPGREAPGHWDQRQAPRGFPVFQGAARDRVRLRPSPGRGTSSTGAHSKWREPASPRWMILSPGTMSHVHPAHLPGRNAVTTARLGGLAGRGACMAVVGAHRPRHSAAYGASAPPGPGFHSRLMSAVIFPQRRHGRASVPIRCLRLPC